MIAHLADAWPIAIIATILRIAQPATRPAQPHVPAEVDLAQAVAVVRGIAYGGREL